MTTATKTNKCNVYELEAGTKWSRVSYGKVVSSELPGNIEVENEAGKRWTIGRSIFEDEFYTADQFDSTEDLSRTGMVEKILASARIIMTVHFRKKPEPKTLTAAVQGLLSDARAGAEVLSPRRLTSFLKNATAGEERTMIGRHQGTVDEFGRLQFMAMEESGGLRQIDPRTVEWCIIANVKYILK